MYSAGTPPNCCSVKMATLLARPLTLVWTKAQSVQYSHPDNMVQLGFPVFMAHW